jgi:hypothetical protein
VEMRSKRTLSPPSTFRTHLEDLSGRIRFGLPAKTASSIRPLEKQSRLSMVAI